MNREGHRYAFLVGIVIGLMVNLGLLPWFQRGPAEGGGGGVRIGLSPLATAKAEQTPETAMASAFRALELPYVEGETVLVGDDASMTYFDATTQAALVASGGVIGPSYDVRLTLAYVDTQDLSAMVVSATQAALAGSASPPPAGFDASAIVAHVSIVAGTLEAGGKSTNVSGLVVQLSMASGNTYGLFTITGHHQDEQAAIAAADSMADRPLTVQPPPGRFRTGGVIDENEQFEDKNCHLIQGCSTRCDCEYNACANDAYKSYDIEIDRISNILAACILIATGLLAVAPFAPSVVAFLITIAGCVAYSLWEIDAANRQYAVDLNACARARAACYMDRCGIVIFEH